mmetsp:Transcript_2187/g.7556  ORF Transcript_2187/g.7556 Transcript_2187/m.7556 type:complete len:125 (-) Transcript_2187:351-725(-)
MPELGWSLSEALFVPLLLKLHLPDRLLTICWLFSPIIGLVMHPVVGAQADIHGRRPFILFFGLVSAAGLAFMLVCAALPDGAASRAASWERCGAGDFGFRAGGLRARSPVFPDVFADERRVRHR